MSSVNFPPLGPRPTQLSTSTPPLTDKSKAIHFVGKVLNQKLDSDASSFSLLEKVTYIKKHDVALVEEKATVSDEDILSLINLQTNILRIQQAAIPEAKHDDFDILNALEAAIQKNEKYKKHLDKILPLRLEGDHLSQDQEFIIRMLILIPEESVDLVLDDLITFSQLWGEDLSIPYADSSLDHIKQLSSQSLVLFVKILNEIPKKYESIGQAFSFASRIKYNKMDAADGEILARIMKNFSTHCESKHSFEKAINIIIRVKNPEFTLKTASKIVEFHKENGTKSFDSIVKALRRCKHPELFTQHLDDFLPQVDFDSLIGFISKLDTILDKENHVELLDFFKRNISSYQGEEQDDFLGIVLKLGLETWNQEGVSETLEKVIKNESPKSRTFFFRYFPCIDLTQLDEVYSFYHDHLLHLVEKLSRYDPAPEYTLEAVLGNIQALNINILQEALADADEPIIQDTINFLKLADSSELSSLTKEQRIQLVQVLKEQGSEKIAKAIDLLHLNLSDVIELFQGDNIDQKLRQHCLQLRSPEALEAFSQWMNSPTESKEMAEVAFIMGKQELAEKLGYTEGSADEQLLHRATRYRDRVLQAHSRAINESHEKVYGNNDYFQREAARGTIYTMTLLSKGEIDRGLILYLARLRQDTARFCGTESAGDFGSMRLDSDVGTPMSGPFYGTYGEMIKKRFPDSENIRFGVEINGKQILLQELIIKDEHAGKPKVIALGQPFEQNELLLEELVDKINEIQRKSYDQAEELRKDVAELHWFFANYMPFSRGSASIGEMLTDGIWLSKGFDPPRTPKGVSLDCLAMISPEIEPYIEEYLQGIPLTQLE